MRDPFLIDEETLRRVLMIVVWVALVLALVEFCTRAQ